MCECMRRECTRVKRSKANEFKYSRELGAICLIFTFIVETFLFIVSTYSIRYENRNDFTVLNSSGIVENSWSHIAE